MVTKPRRCGTRASHMKQNGSIFLIFAGRLVQKPFTELQITASYRNMIRRCEGWGCWSFKFNRKYIRICPSSRKVCMQNLFHSYWELQCLLKIWADHACEWRLLQQCFPSLMVRLPLQAQAQTNVPFAWQNYFSFRKSPGYIYLLISLSFHSRFLKYFL